MIAEYLNGAFKTGDTSLITKAIGDMMRAQGMSRISKKVGLRREGLYRSFRGDMGPGFDTVIKVLLALNIQLVAKLREKVEGKGNENSTKAVDAQGRRTTSRINT
jgi:probable addiction module antidote protein